MSEAGPGKGERIVSQSNSLGKRGERWRRGSVARWLALGLLAVAVAVAGIVWMPLGRQKVAKAESVAPKKTVAAVQVIRPELRALCCSVVQPGFLEPFEQTAVCSKASGFIKEFNVDIGQPIKKGQVLAEVLVPELEEDHDRKAAQVELNRKQIELAEQMVAVAQSKVRMADAQLMEAKADVGSSQADIVRWESEVRRLTTMVQERVMDRQVLDETQKQLSAGRSSHDAAIANVAAKEAARQSAMADLGKARIDVEVNKAQLKATEADERRAAALLAYAKITAPYDGIVTERNANTGDFVQAASSERSGPGPRPLFTVARSDVMRLWVDVPESYARDVQPGTKAVIRTQALSRLEFPATVTRTSWSLNPKTRTLRAEIDLPAKDYEGLRPGMYVYAKILVERSKVHTVPESVLAVSGNHTYCYLLQGKRAVRTVVEPGMSDGGHVEVLKKKVGDSWVPFKDDDTFIVGDLNELSDGQEVQATFAAKSP